MANFTKSGGAASANALLALQSVAASSVVKSTVVDVSQKFGAFIAIHFGRRIATAAGAGVNIRVEASPETAGDGFWVPLVTYTTDFAACEPEAATGTNSAGQAVIQMASTANLLVGNIIFIDNSTIGNSEWGRIKSIVVNTSITLEDNLLFAQNAGAATIYNKAEMYPCQVDLTPHLRLRVVVDGSLFTQAFAIRARLSSGDSIA